jgi:hypothetical protein
MATYVRQSSCSTFDIPSKNGPIKIQGAPLYPTVVFPVSDQTFINSYCEKQKNKTDAEIRQCKNFLRNENLVNFVASQAMNFGNPYTQMLIQDLGICQSEGIGDYIQQRSKNSSLNNSQNTNILSTCNL